jgi:hypothetical protein
VAGRPDYTQAIAVATSVALSSTAQNPVTPKQKITVTTLVNAASIASAAWTDWTALGLDGTESEVWILVSTDKQPWIMSVQNFGSATVDAVFPSRVADQATTHTFEVPCLSFYLGVGNVSQGLVAATTLLEARQYPLLYGANGSVRVQNKHATDAATITVRVARIWR